jgi:hypothetical protein
MIATKSQARKTDTESMDEFANWVAKAAHITPPGQQCPQLISVSADLQPVRAGSATTTMEFSASFLAYSDNYREKLTTFWKYQFEKDHTEKDPDYVEHQMQSLAQEVRGKCSLLEVSCKANTLEVSLLHK